MTATNRTSIQRLLRDEHEQLEQVLCDKVGITVDQYKAIRFAYRFIGIAIFAAVAVFPSVTLTPTQSLVLGGLILGPDVAEAYLTRNQNK